MNSQLTKLRIQDLGLVDFELAYQIQRRIHSEVVAGGTQTLLLCEHPAVLTLGRLAKAENLLLPQEQILVQGIKILNVDRGGDVTLHAPGQLIAYPILALNQHGRDLKRYLWKLEEVAIDFLKGFGILTERFPGRTGVWIGHQKIASIGVGVKKWVSFHGIGINLNTDLKLFSLIRPCGMDVEMTSASKILARPVLWPQALEKFKESFCREFNFIPE